MTDDEIKLLVECLTEKSRQIDPQYMKLLDAHPRARKKLRRYLAARGLSAGDIQTVLNGTVPDSALPALAGLNTAPKPPAQTFASTAKAPCENTPATVREQTRSLLEQAKGNPAALAMLRRELGALSLPSEAVDRILRGELRDEDLPALLSFNHHKN